MDQQASIQFLRDLVNSHTTARCLHVVAELGVADFLQDEPATAAELACQTGANADALNRMLRLLASHGVFASEPTGYVHTAASRLLRSDHPKSLKSLARMMGLPIIWNGFTDLGKSARTGAPALSWSELMNYFKDHAGEARLFNEAMVAKSGAIIPAVVEAYDFDRFGVIADIGGGRGHMLHAILEGTRNATGILFELPQVIADCTHVASSRLRVQSGDFFVDPLPAADIYLLMEVLHDWPDDKAARILEAIRRAAPRQSRLLIVETLVSDAPGPHFGKTLDVIMLAITGGRERTAEQYQALIDAAGFRFSRVIPTRSQHSIVEAFVA